MSTLLEGWIFGGFECSCHRRRDGRRLDMIAATRHDLFAAADYRRLAGLGIKTARDGVRWHLIENTPGKFDFRTVEDQLNAAADSGVQVIWDLFHYGYPDHVDIFSAEFPARFADLAYAFAKFHSQQAVGPLFFVPINEISFFSWIAGDIGHFYPFAIQRGDEMKRQLVRAAVEAIRAVMSVDRSARIITSEPVTYIRARPDEPELSSAAESYRLSQYEAFDMLSGRLFPELGGQPEYLDIVGINFYPHNQWFYPDREMIPGGHEFYRPFSEILLEVAERYRRPMVISETGTEGDLRAGWFRYVASECKIARDNGVDLNGICLYPIVNHPGWEDGRHCHNGLWDYCDETGRRTIFEPLAKEVRSATSLKAQAPAPVPDSRRMAASSAGEEETSRN